MDRKKFIQTSGIGLGFALVPGIVKHKNPSGRIASNTGSDPKIIRAGEGDVFNVIGDLQTHKLTGTETGNQITEWANVVEPGVGIPPHIHANEDEIFRVIQGEVEMMVDGETTVLKAGDIAFAPKNIPHSWTVVGDENAKMITSAFPSGIESMFHELASMPAGPPNFEKVAEICSRYGVSFV